MPFFLMFLFAGEFSHSQTVTTTDSDSVLHCNGTATLTGVGADAEWFFHWEDSDGVQIRFTTVPVVHGLCRGAYSVWWKDKPSYVFHRVSFYIDGSIPSDSYAAATGIPEYSPLELSVYCSSNRLFVGSGFRSFRIYNMSGQEVYSDSSHPEEFDLSFL